MTATYHDPYDDGYPEEDDPRYIGDEWKRNPPADVLQWYPVAIRKWLLTEVFAGDGGLGWIAKYQKWYQDRPTEFLLYERPTEGPSMWGGWRINEMAMWGAVERADADLGWVEPEEPTEPKKAVEPATEADVDAALARMETEKNPEERHVARALTDEVWTRLCETANRIRAKTPVPCQCCRQFFTPGRQQVVNCPECRKAGRKRCLTCGEVFTTSNRHIRRCDSCRADEAEYKAKHKHHH